jgi:hypothetical protein
MDQVLDHAKGRKAKELVQEYVRREPDAVTLVHQILTDAGASHRRRGEHGRPHGRGPRGETGRH